MAAVALDLALFARLAAHAQFFAFALPTVAACRLVAGRSVSDAPSVVVVVMVVVVIAERILRRPGRGLWACTLVVRRERAISSRCIHCRTKRLQQAR
jgi:hypothetical protein